jgi:mannose-6-phosphate isomerase
MTNTQTLDSNPKFDQRPWGSFTVLDESESFKVKRLEVLPGKRLSYQRHQHRAEHWFIVQGEALITLDGENLRVLKGQAIDIPLGAAHRIENPGEELLILVEVQSGSYFGEDDIERMEDDFGRNNLPGTFNGIY